VSVCSELASGCPGLRTHARREMVTSAAIYRSDWRSSVALEGMLIVVLLCAGTARLAADRGVGRILRSGDCNRLQLPPLRYSHRSSSSLSSHCSSKMHSVYFDPIFCCQYPPTVPFSAIMHNFQGQSSRQHGQKTDVGIISQYLRKGRTVRQSVH